MENISKRLQFFEITDELCDTIEYDLRSLTYHCISLTVTRNVVEMCFSLERDLLQ